MEVFEIRGKDRRRELIKAFGKEWTFRAQKPFGSDVEYFSPETGFVLLKKEAELNLTKKYMERVYACAQLSLGSPLELREFYYTIRQTPELAKYFSGIHPDLIYHIVLDSLNLMEIICDVDRHVFTMGNLSKGFIYDAHSYSFYDKEKKVGFTETIARTLDPSELATSANIIFVEKNAAATRLVEMGFSELTNSCIVTAGGNFNRAIWFLTERYKDSKNLIYLCDGDVYGDDMLRTIEFGTKNSRHLPFKFPPSKYPNIHLAGLWPSIAERLGLANDVSEKRPLNNKYAKKRLEFLQRYNLVDQRDIATWRRNKTYELEALSTAFKSKDTGEPIGLGIYLIEYMRLKNIPIKPPIPPDEELKKKFDEAAHEELKREIKEAILSESSMLWIKIAVEEVLKHYIKRIAEQIYSQYKEKLDKALEKVGAKEIKYHILQQFKEDPTRKEFDYHAIAHKLKAEFTVETEVDDDEIKEILREAIKAYFEPILKEQKWSTYIAFEPIHNEDEQPDIYDIILEKLGARKEDAEQVREALKWRFCQAA